MTTKKAAKVNKRTANSWEKFRLLLWKNFLQQWRHKLQTAAEIILPVLTCALVLILRALIDPKAYEQLEYPAIDAYSLRYSGGSLNGLTSLNVAYSPESPVLYNIVRSAINLLIFKNLFIFAPDLPDVIPPEFENVTQVIFGRLVQIDAYPSSLDIEQVFMRPNATTEVVAAIQFDDSLFGATELPDNIEYELRFPKRLRQREFLNIGGWSWRTDLVFPRFPSPGPRFPFSWEGGNDPGYVNEMFTPIQHALSMTIIAAKARSLDIVNFDVNIQRYPHPPYIMDEVLGALQLLMPMFLVLSFAYPTINIIRAVTREKETQLKESMKIMGLPTWLHWTAWFVKFYFFLLVTCLLIVVILKMEVYVSEEGLTGYSVFTNTPWTVLLFFFAVYIMCLICFAFMITGMFFKANTAALFGAVIWFISYLPAMLMNVETSVSMAVQIVSSLSINTAMALGVQLMLVNEMNAKGMHWGDFFTSNSTDTNLLFGHVILLMLADSALYMLVALYLEQVWPGEHGTRQAWYFPVQPSFWFPDKSVKYVVGESAPEGEDVIRESDPVERKVGVEIKELTKVYDTKTAVNRLNLNIYNGQITVLLGHNGAGKTTTISMLTGMTLPSYGTARVAGYDITTQLKYARGELGICPQHNVIFNDLTIREHLQFFARLKGLSGKQMIEDTSEVIEKLELADKADDMAGNLSGGQMRRLCVGIALSGKPEVVLLDEPTSGMDPSSRRALWDLLLREKEGRTIILTTHFMDEADILGDRIAILSGGKLQCVGSPFFLKKHYDIGYSLVIVKNKEFNLETCTAFLTANIPNTALSQVVNEEVTYILPNEHIGKFPNVLESLEENFQSLGIRSYGLTAAKVEDVFMKTGSDVKTYEISGNNTKEEEDSSDATESNLSVFTSAELLETHSEKVTGCQLQINHVLAMWMKLGLVWIRSWRLVLLQFLVPIIILSITFILFNLISGMNDNLIPRLLRITEGYTNTETLVNAIDTLPEDSLGERALQSYVDFFSTTHKHFVRETEKDVPDHYLEMAGDSLNLAQMRYTHVIGASFGASEATAWFSNFGYHDLPVSLAHVHNAILQSFLPNASLTVYNHPLEALYDDYTDLLLLNSLLSLQLSAGVATTISVICATFVLFYVKERLSRAKLLQKASGIQPLVMWGSAAVIDFLWFLVLSVVTIFMLYIFSIDGFTTWIGVGRGLIVFVIFAAAMLPLHYLFSFVLPGAASGFVIVYFIHVLLGQMAPQIVEALMSPVLSTRDTAEILDYVFQFYPLYPFVCSIRQLNTISLTETTCAYVCQLPASAQLDGNCSMSALCDLGFDYCCMSENAHFLWERPGIGRYLAMMVITTVILWIALLLIEYQPWKRIPKLRCGRGAPSPPEPSEEDEDVAAERQHVAGLTATSLPRYHLVCRDLAKTYGKRRVVNNLSFSVTEKECFGLLGVNGAGKTTTFKMLTGDVSISSGDAYVCGHSVSNNIKAVHKNIGYCPQFDALFDELTGRETLRLYALLRGLETRTAAALSSELAHRLGFHKHMDKRVEHYSGGNKRKLSTAVAMLGYARLLYLDEPTTGVDPAAKRQVWRAVQMASRAGRSVLLTSHSMEECEALCTRLTIMVDGAFRCLGSPQHLKNKFSQGYTLIVKMRCTGEMKMQADSPEVLEFKRYIEENFPNCLLMESHQGLFTYYITNRTTPWSKIFRIMEEAKRQVYVEDYTISQTSLEQVYLQFTKYQTHS